MHLESITNNIEDTYYDSFTVRQTGACVFKNMPNIIYYPYIYGRVKPTPEHIVTEKLYRQLVNSIRVCICVPVHSMLFLECTIR
jgi:hypothetical protein